MPTCFASNHCRSFLKNTPHSAHKSLSWIIAPHSAVTHLYFAFAKLSFVLLRATSSFAYAPLYAKSAEPPKCDSSPTQLHNKRDVIISQHLFYGVDGVTILEPNDKETISQKTLPNNIYHRIVYIMKQTTQGYYNMRMLLGLKLN